jgi:serine/threonine protein kinase
MKHCPLCEQQFSDEHTTCPHDGMQLVVSYEWAAQTLIRGKYRILGKLGQGGMGIVYKAQHILMGEPRALKVMSPELARDPSFLRRFRHEAQSASKLKHPNIVQVNDLDQAEDGSLFMAMEYVDGVSLRQLLTDAHGPLLLARALAIARGMAEALGAAHAAGMVHRDIKPENVLIARDAQGRDAAKILDFGIVAMRESSGQLSSAVIQTDAYASPEQWMGMKSDEIDGRTDLYSLGMTLFEMLTGRLPFESYNRLGWMRAHLDLQPPPPSSLNSSLPTSVDELVLRLLAKDRDTRTPNAEVFIEQLKLVEAGMAYSAPTVLPKVPSGAEGPKTPPLARREVPQPAPPKIPTPPREVAVKTPPRQPERVPVTEPPMTFVETVEPHITIPPVRSMAKEQKPAPKAQTRWILWTGVAIVVVMIAGTYYWSETRSTAPTPPVVSERRNEPAPQTPVPVLKSEPSSTSQSKPKAQEPAVPTFVLERTLTHGDTLESVAFSPDCRTLASSDYRGILKLWDVSTGQMVRSLAARTDGLRVRGLAFSPDGRLLAASSGKEVKFWDTATWLNVHTLAGHSSEVFGVAFSPDSRRLHRGVSIRPSSCGWRQRVRNCALLLVTPRTSAA